MFPIQTNILKGGLWQLPLNFDRKVWHPPVNVGWHSIERSGKGYRALLVDKCGRIYGTRKIQNLVVDPLDNTRAYGRLSVRGHMVKAWLTIQLILTSNGAAGFMMQVLQIDDLPAAKNKVVAQPPLAPYVPPPPYTPENRYLHVERTW